jgi:hypothetical protein
MGEHYITVEHSQPDSYVKFAKNTRQQIIQPYAAFHADVHHQFAGNNQDAGEQIYSTRTNKSKTRGAAQGAQIKDGRSREAKTSVKTL